MATPLTTDPGRRSTARRSDDHSGFTIAEVVVGVMLLGSFLLMCVGVVRAAKRALPGAEVSLGGETLPIAPSPGAFASAVKLHGVFLERLASARAVYVLGGTHQGLPAGASRLSGAPLAAEGLPTIPSFSPGLPTDAYGFYQLYSAHLGATATASAPSDFSVLIVGPWNGRLGLTALVQVRERRLVAGDQESSEVWIRRDTVLYDISGDGEALSFVEKEGVAAAEAVGARHFWHRYEEGRVADEGAVVAVFPDPWLYVGTRTTNREQIPPYSRFTYVLAVTP